MELKELQVIAGERGFDLETIVKDYYLTLLLHRLSGINRLCFKGGTALNKICFNHIRLSEDLDFSVKGSIGTVETQIRRALGQEKEFVKVTHDKKTKQFVRLLVHYETALKPDYIIVDLNQKASIRLKPEEKEVKHFYRGKIPKFSIRTLNFEELVAEKVSAAFQRNAPRDYYDLYNIIIRRMFINERLVKQKLKEHGQRFDISRLFKPGSRVYSRWEADLLPLTKTKPSWKKVIKKIAEYFKYRKNPLS